LLKITKRHRQALQAECRVAEAAAIHFRSIANQARFIQARDARKTAGSPAAQSLLVRSMRDLLYEEIALAKRLHAIQSMDSRIGFEASNHYFYIPLDLVEKVLNCRCLLELLE
jgi:hypothetical protein